MRRLQMGMWYGFDQNLWDNYGSDLINGLEISQYKNREQLDRLAEFCQSREISFGIHTPVLITDKEDYSLPMLTALDRVERDGALKRIEDEVLIASQYQADYSLSISTNRSYSKRSSLLEPANCV